MITICHHIQWLLKLIPNLFGCNGASLGSMDTKLDLWDQLRWIERAKEVTFLCYYEMSKIMSLATILLYITIQIDIN